MERRPRGKRKMRTVTEADRNKDRRRAKKRQCDAKRGEERCIEAKRSK